MQVSISFNVHILFLNLKILVVIYKLCFSYDLQFEQHNYKSIAAFNTLLLLIIFLKYILDLNLHHSYISLIKTSEWSNFEKRIFYNTLENVSNSKLNSISVAYGQLQNITHH